MPELVNMNEYITKELVGLKPKNRYFESILELDGLQRSTSDLWEA